jgi:hypothetical protein
MLASKSCCRIGPWLARAAFTSSDHPAALHPARRAPLWNGFQGSCQSRPGAGRRAVEVAFSSTEISAEVPRSRYKLRPKSW